MHLLGYEKGSVHSRWIYKSCCMYSHRFILDEKSAFVKGSGEHIKLIGTPLSENRNI